MTGLDGQSLYTTEAESEVIEQCAISHGMAMLAWGTEGGSIRLLSLKTKSVKVVGVQSNRRMTHLKFSPTDVLLMSASEDGCIKVGHNQLRDILPSGYERVVFVFLLGVSNFDQIWKHDGDCVTVWGPRKGVVGCHFVDHETQLLICGVDGSVRMWRVDNGHPTAVLLQDIGLHVICFDLSADGVSFAQGTSSHGLQLISVNTDLVTWALATIYCHGAVIESIFFTVPFFRKSWIASQCALVTRNLLSASAVSIIRTLGHWSQLDTTQESSRYLLCISIIPSYVTELFKAGLLPLKSSCGF